MNKEFIICILSYLLGSVPFSLIITKMKGIDLRIIGSGNIGATNVFRSGQKYLAALVLLLDTFKGFIAVYVAQQFLSDLYVHFSVILVVLGHMFPVWTKLKGGKGVATTLGVLFALNIFVAMIFIFTWLVIFFVFRYSSLASLGAIITIPLLLQEVTLVVVAILIFLKHYTNIARLMQGKEYKL